MHRFINDHAPMPSLAIADLALIEITAAPLVPLPGTSGAVFRGSVGALEMTISNCSAARVTTTAAQYNFLPTDATIEAWQRIDFPRQVGTWNLSVSLAGLAVLSFKRGPRGHCVLGNAGISIGVQPDGVLVLVPQRDATVTLTNHIGGTFNRLSTGNLLSEDDFGGITVTPQIPLGSGRPARCSVLTSNLSFVNDPGLKPTKTTPSLKFDNNYTHAETPNWKIQWALSSGEHGRLQAFFPQGCVAHTDGTVFQVSGCSRLSCRSAHTTGRNHSSSAGPKSLTTSPRAALRLKMSHRSCFGMRRLKYMEAHSLADTFRTRAPQLSNAGWIPCIEPGRRL